jgi:hypothetical protein
MAEKRGDLVKLTYKFNSARCCEVSFNGEKWARVTAREFRSFNGKRRILNVDNPSKAYYEEYLGPIYYYGTNRIAEEPKEAGTTFLNGIDPRDAKRPQLPSYF